MILASAVAWLHQARVPLRCAAGLALLALPAAAANAQTPCTGAAWAVQNDGNYNFSYANRQQRGTIAFCVRNQHGRRGVFVDWQGAGLRSAIPPGRTIFRTSLRNARPARPRLFPFFYGARPNQIDVPTLAAHGGFAPLPVAALFRRAAIWQAEPVAAEPEPEPGGTNALVYIPHPALVRMARIALGRDRLPAYIASIEANPDYLTPFVITFDERVTADPEGGITIAYECRYRFGTRLRNRRRQQTRPPTEGESHMTLFLRFSDPALHRLMFQRDSAARIMFPGSETLLRASASAPRPGGVAVRTAVLEVLVGHSINPLAGERTVIASIPVTFSAPVS